MRAFEIEDRYGRSLQVQPGEESSTLFVDGKRIDLSPDDVQRLLDGLTPASARELNRQQVRRIVAERRRELVAGRGRTTPLRSSHRPAVPAGTRRLIEKRSGGHCELRLPGCWGQATDPAHRKGRKAGGRFGQARIDQSQASAVLFACRHCHNLTTSATEPHLSEYRLYGWLLREHQEPLRVPVLLRHAGKVWLDNAGNYCDEPQAGVAS